MNNVTGENKLLCLGCSTREGPVRGVAEHCLSGFSSKTGQKRGEKGQDPRPVSMLSFPTAASRPHFFDFLQLLVWSLAILV